MSFNIGLSALQASQSGIDVVSQNIANASTPGYHRQKIHYSAMQLTMPGQVTYGNGVRVEDVERIRNQVIEAALTSSISDLSQIQQTITIESQVEGLFLPGDGSIQELLDSFFNNITELAANPSDATSRNVSVQSAEHLTEVFKNIASQLAEIKNAVRAQITSEVDVLNGRMKELGALNEEIAYSQATSTPNGLLDQRDELINQIASAVDLSRADFSPTGVNLMFGNHSIQQDPGDTNFILFTGNSKLQMALESPDSPLTVGSGRLAALLETFNETIPAFEKKLDDLASGLIQQFDQVHAQGIGVNGPFSTLKSNRSVEDASVPLNDSGIAFPVEAGSLYFSLTDANGEHRTYSVDIDPAVESLDDIAAKISTLPNLNSFVDPRTGTMKINAAPGTQFDFTGVLESIPSLASFTGSSLPRISGEYLGTDNRDISVEMVGSGNVGVTTGLLARVRDEFGSVIGEFEIGDEYEAGSPIDIGDGVFLEFNPGTVVDGDSFSTTFVQNSDDTGFLSAMGLNSFFTGSDATTIGVDAKILADPRLFSSSTTGEAADATALFNFLELKDSKSMTDGKYSFREYVNELTVEIGTSVRTNLRLSVSLETVQERYIDERTSYSGVDVNEEMVQLAQFQKAYQAAVRVIQTAEAMMDDLFNVIR